MERLKKTLLYTYGVADLCFTLMMNMESFIFTVFLTDYARFSLNIAQKILWFTGSIDILFALAGGAILQKITLKFGGKYRSWFLVGPPVLAPLFILQFTKIGSDGTAAWIIMFGFITSHLLFNVVFSANGAMLGRLSRLPEERTILSTSRAQGISAAGLIFSASAVPMIGFFTARTDKITGITMATAVYAALMILGYWYLYRITAGKDPYDETPMDVSQNKSGQSLKDIIDLVFRNPPLLFLILSQIFLNASTFIITSLAIYYFTYVAGNVAFLSVFILAVSIARLSGAFAARWIGVRIGKRHSYWIFLALAAGGFASVRLVSEGLWAFTLAFCICVTLMSVASSMSSALYADTVVYGEWKTGRNIRAFIMALLNFPIKAGILIRSTIVTAGLMAIGFIANTTPTPGVVEGIRTIMTLAPAAGNILAAMIFYFGYRIDDSHVLKMEEEIAAKKA